jgi:integrase
MRMKLDTRSVASLTLDDGARELFAWDIEMPGFGLKLWRKRDGSAILRSFVTQYRHHGRTRRHTLGSTAKVSLTAGREAARRILGGAALGFDPAGEKKAKRERAARTFGAVVDSYLAAAAGRLRPGSLRLGVLYLRGDYFAPLFGTPIDQITRADIASCLTAAARRHSSNSAASARRWASTLFGWAVEEGWLPGDNPVNGTRKPQRSAARERVLSDQELVCIWNACGDDEHGRIVRLLVLLGARRQEVGGMCWSELDHVLTGDGGLPVPVSIWTLPAARSKNRRSHCITLPPAALEIIESVPRRACDQLFGSLWGAHRGFQIWGRSKSMLDERLGFERPWTLHDLRRTVATGMIDLGIEPHHVEAVLNHHSGHRAGIKGIYNRSPYTAAIAAALLRWSAHIDDLLAGRDTNVIAIRK